MGKFNGEFAAVLAKEAVTAALQSGTIKLLGTGNQLVADANAKADAKYLSTLVDEIYSQLKA
jgi:hypothetical protein